MLFYDKSIIAHHLYAILFLYYIIVFRYIFDTFLTFYIILVYLFMFILLLVLSIFSFNCGANGVNVVCILG